MGGIERVVRNFTTGSTSPKPNVISVQEIQFFLHACASKSYFRVYVSDNEI
jgi:Holliday junction resolvase